MDSTALPVEERDADPNGVSYVTPPTVGDFMQDDHFVRLILGPVGSGKSAGCFMELLRRAKLQEPHRGVRKTRFAIVRNTLQQLRQTCLADIQLWLSPIAHFYGRDQTIQIRFPLPDGTQVESDWMLIPLDTKEDQQRLLSLNLTGAWVSEFREIPLDIMDALAGRLGRFPTRAMVDPTWFGIIAESNPPDEDSEWYEKLELKRPANWGVFKQPGGLTPEAENVENLPPNYYPNLAANNGPDWVDVHVHAKYGKSLSGQAVFRRSFKSSFHISPTRLQLTNDMPLMIGQDFGRTPACLFSQIDARGRLLILDELTSEDMGIEQFTTTYTRPMIFSKYMGFRTFMVGDPKGRDKSQVNEDSPFDVLERLGFMIFPATTNSVNARLQAVENLLLQQRDGGPMLIIDEQGCPKLCQALKYNYRYKRKKSGQLEDEPEKLHPWSDLADCLQYLCLSTNLNYLGKIMRRMAPPPPRPPPPTGGWT
jgi:hypothetical protein